MFKNQYRFVVTAIVGLTLVVDAALAQRSPPLPIGFEVADTNADGKITKSELTVYLRDRLKDDSLPFKKIFEKLDANQDGTISPAEFDNRHAVLEKFLNQEEDDSVPADPGTGFVPFAGLDQPLSDRDIFGAIYHRYLEQIEQPAAWKSVGWKRTRLQNLSQSAPIKLPSFDGQKLTLDHLIRATLVIGGDGSDEDFFTGGAVIISPDGLALTNYHIAEDFNKKLVGLMSDGRIVRVTKFLAGDPATDVALVQLEGTDFPWVPIATKAPTMADDIVVMHHTENRFYTYDRGYIKRYPLIGKHPWMEISADYAQGGSGFGIFNSNHELVGLVSMIVMGDGLAIADSDLMDDDDDWCDDDEEDWPEPGALVVKLAVPWSAIQSVAKPKK